MSRRRVALLVTSGLLVVALFGLSVAVAPGDGPVRPEEAGGLQLVDRLLARVPGLSRSLGPDDVTTEPPGCFDDGRFRAGSALVPCRLLVPTDVDRLVVGDLSPGCRLEVTGQEDVLDHVLGPGDAGDDGQLRIALSGAGATVLFQAPSTDRPCSAALVTP